VSFRSFLTTSKNVTRSGFVWNTTSSGLFALQSLIMLIVTQNVLGKNDAGMLAIAQAIAFLLGCIGTFGVARYQASDVKRLYSFADYVAIRVVTIVAMWAAAAIVLVIRSGAYDATKIGIVTLMVLLKTVDVVGDVFFGHFQRVGRIDVAGRTTALRTTVSIITFIVALLACRQLVTSLIITVVLSTVVLVAIAIITLPEFVPEPERRLDRHALSHLLAACAPMFVAWFLSGYLTNAPRYSIDAVTNESTQAIYGFLVSPAFVVSLLAQFLFNPLIYRYSLMWAQGQAKQLRQSVLRMLVSIVGIGAAVCLLGYFIGLPILGWVYQTDLQPYRAEFMTLLVAGTTTATSAFLYTVITIMRKQAVLAVCYLIVSLGALLGGAPLVRQFDLMGASMLYLGTTLILSVCFLIVTLVFLARDTSTKEQPDATEQALLAL